MFFRSQRAGDHIIGVIHGSPRLRNQIRRMRVVEIDGEKERSTLDIAFFNECNCPFACPVGVMERLGKTPYVTVRVRA